MMSFYYPRPSPGRMIDLWAAPSPAPEEGGYSDVIEAEGTPLTTPEDCGFVFAGYAIPLLDPVENFDEEDSACPEGWTVWSEWIGWHVATASTCTIQLHTGTMRMYIPEPRLVREERGVANEDGFPLRHPNSTEGLRYPDLDWSSVADGGTLRFSSDYISFVDSADGLQFPIYAPKMSLGRFGCSDWDFDNPDWTTAGWTPTCVPSRSVAGTPAGEKFRRADGRIGFVYSIYRDPSVVYVASRNVYLMFAVECRGLTEYVGASGTNPCDSAPHAAAFTRFVVFLSTSPDFAEATTSPNPVDASALAVLLQPEFGAAGPAGFLKASEAYGVPHATMNEAGDKVLAYVAWDPTTPGDAPPRMRALYPDGYPPWMPEATPGVSVFAIDAGALVDALDAGDNAEVLALATAGYQGEALFTDNTRVGDALQTLWGIDHQFVLCGGHLWAWYGAADGCVYGFGEVECGMGVNQIRRLQHVPIAELPWELRDLFEDTAQGDYTVFLAPSSCWIAYDLDPVLPRGGEPLAASTRDPDVAVLPDGRLRVSTSYQGPADKFGEADEGLVQVIATEHTLCAREDFFTSEPLDCDTLCSSSNLGDQVLCTLMCHDASVDIDRCDALCARTDLSSRLECAALCHGGLDTAYCDALCARTDPLSRLLCELNCGGLQVSPRIDEPSPYPGVIVGNDSTLWRHEYTTTRGARIFSWP